MKKETENSHIQKKRKGMAEKYVRDNSIDVDDPYTFDKEKAIEVWTEIVSRFHRIEKPQHKFDFDGPMIKSFFQCLTLGFSEINAAKAIGISIRRLYQIKDCMPGYAQVISRLNMKMEVDAMKTISQDIGKVSTAKWFLEKTRFKKENSFNINTTNNTLNISGESPLRSLEKMGMPTKQIINESTDIAYEESNPMD